MMNPISNGHTWYRFHPFLQAFLLISLIIIFYYPAIYADYLWDDDIAITENMLLRSNEGLWKIWMEPSIVPQEHYWPMVYSTFWLEFQFWGNNPMGYHIVNIILHIFNVLLIWFIFHKLSVPGAWWIAAIFALHPVHVESVVWVIERKDLLSAFFYLSSFLIYMYYDEKKKISIYILSLIFFVFALLSKSITIGLPIILFLWLWWKNEKLEKKQFYSLIPFLLIAIGITIGDMTLSRVELPVQTGLNILERFLIAGRALWFYMGQLIWPLNFMAIYPKWNIDIYSIPQYLYPIGFLFILIVLWVKRISWGKGPLIAFLFFGITLGPILGIVDFAFMNYTYVADRFQYLASLGIIGLGVSGITFWFPKVTFVWQKVILIIGTVLLLFYGILTYQHVRIHKNNWTLFTHTLNRNSDAWMAYNVLGTYLMDQNKPKEAVPYFQKALKLKPNYYLPLNNLANILVSENQFSEAVSYYEKSIQSKPDYAIAYNNLALAQVELSKYEEAENNYKKAIELKPDYWDAFNNYGYLSVKLGDRKKAESLYLKALEINPEYAEAYNNLAILLVDKGDLDEAIDCYNKAIHFKPDFAEAYNNLALVLVKQKKLRLAVDYFKKAIELKPDYENARENLKVVQNYLEK